MPTKKSTITEREKPTKKRTKLFEESKSDDESKSGGFDFLRLGESYTSLILGIIVVVIATVLLLSYVHGKNTNGVINSQQQTLSEHTVQSPKKIAQVNKEVSITLAPTTVFRPTHRHSPSKIAFVSKRSNLPTVQSTNVRMARNNHFTKHQVYVVQKGDSLWSIAVKEYNNGYDWVKIAQANNLVNPGTIYSGNNLVIPSIVQQNSTNNIAQRSGNILASAKHSNATSLTNNIATGAITGNSYTIVKGDNLWTISVRAYGNGYEWVKIARANNLSNPGLINSGNVLIIPRS